MIFDGTPSELSAAFYYSLEKGLEKRGEKGRSEDVTPSSKEATDGRTDVKGTRRKVENFPTNFNQGSREEFPSIFPKIDV